MKFQFIAGTTYFIRTQTVAPFAFYKYSVDYFINGRLTASYVATHTLATVFSFHNSYGPSNERPCRD